MIISSAASFADIVALAVVLVVVDAAAVAVVGSRQ